MSAENVSEFSELSEQLDQLRKQINALVEENTRLKKQLEGLLRKYPEEKNGA